MTLSVEVKGGIQRNRIMIEMPFQGGDYEGAGLGAGWSVRLESCQQFEQMVVAVSHR